MRIGDSLVVRSGIFIGTCMSVVQLPGSFPATAQQWDAFQDGIAHGESAGDHHVGAPPTPSSSCGLLGCSTAPRGLPASNAA